MENYKQIIIAVDLHPDCDSSILERAIVLAKQSNAKLTIIHAVEHINAYGIAQAYPAVIDVEDEMRKDAEVQLQKLRDQHNLTNAEITVEIGTPKMVIIDKAKEVKADLIILGSHGRHGLQLIMGSTANAVLHHAECDVLAVRVQ